MLLGAWSKVGALQDGLPWVAFGDERAKNVDARPRSDIGRRSGASVAERLRKRDKSTG
jgi:hypothetical protein